MLYHLGRLDEAEEAYLRALRICPRYAGALAHLSTLRLDQQRYEEALESLDRALALDPHQQQAQDARARILQESARP